MDMKTLNDKKYKLIKKRKEAVNKIKTLNKQNIYSKQKGKILFHYKKKSFVNDSELVLDKQTSNQSNLQNNQIIEVIIKYISGKYIAKIDSINQKEDDNKIGLVEFKRKLSQDKGMIDRGKRMFGFLKQNLVQADKIIQKDRQKIDHMRGSINIAELKDIQVIENLRQGGTGENIEDQLTKQQKEKSQIDNQILEIENQILFQKFDSYYKHLRNFIRTDQEPQIFWKPVKMNEKVHKQLEKSQQYVDNKRKEVLQKQNEIFEQFKNSGQQNCFLNNIDESDNESSQNLEEIRKKKTDDSSDSEQ